MLKVYAVGSLLHSSNYVHTEEEQDTFFLTMPSDPEQD